MLLSPTGWFCALSVALISVPASAQTTTSLASAADATTASAAAVQVSLGSEYPTTTATALAAAAGTSPTVVRRPSGLVIEVVREGSGPELTTGATALIHYVLTSDRGTLWDNSRTRTVPRPFKFKTGSGFVVAGMDEGTIGMRVGERRLLHVPPELGYGARGAGGIPPDSRLHFDVELVGIRNEEPAAPSGGDSATTGSM